MSGGDTREAARARDAADPLRARRADYRLPDGLIYLNGNSLGALPVATPARVANVVEEQWGEHLITSWNRHGWIDQPARLGARIARLIGAEPTAVLLADSTSVNTFKLVAAACAARAARSTILTEPGNFPTDLYVATGVAEFTGRRVVLAEADRIVDAIDDDTAVVLLTHVHYKSGVRHDMAAITRAAHARGALIVWDLSHSVGAIDVDLAGCDADMAVGCGYKYLNGGPGAPAFLYVAPRLQDAVRSPLSGWMGHSAPFAFTDDYAPAPGVARFLCGTPPILGMAALESGLDGFDGITMRAVEAKSAELCAVFMAGVEACCAGHGLTLLSPRDPARRGSHLSYAHEDAYALCQALIARGVIGDFRAPDAVRFGFAPLYIGFEDVWRAVDILAEVLEGRLWDDPALRVRSAVT